VSHTTYKHKTSIKHKTNKLEISFFLLFGDPEARVVESNLRSSPKLEDGLGSEIRLMGDL
jgi:hypothetical protein